VTNFDVLEDKLRRVALSPVERAQSQAILQARCRASPESQLLASIWRQLAAEARKITERQ